MPHLHTGDGHHDFTVSAFIARTDRSEPAVVLHEHRKARKLLQFGGHVEVDENPWSGLLRELREEAGYDPGQLTVLQPTGRFHKDFDGADQHPLPFYFNTHRYLSTIEQIHHYHSDLTYAVLVNEEPRHAIGDGESSDIHWFTAGQLRAIPRNQIFDQTRSNALFLIEHLLHDWERIPASQWPL